MSVAFLVAVVAVIQGMNSYVKENVANSLIGTNAFQVRRVPIQLGFFDDEMWKKVSKRPVLTRADFEVVRAALPDAQAIAITSGFPTPLSNVAVAQSRGGRRPDPRHHRAVPGSAGLLARARPRAHGRG